MENCINCDQLLEHLYASCCTCRYCCGGLINFQGHICNIGGVMPNRCAVFMPSTKFPRTVFSIQHKYDNKYFTLCIFKGDTFILDETLGVELPSYIEDELIATIQNYK